MTLPEPVKVSPIIKLFRYGLLVAGILYGASKYRYFQHKEAAGKEEKIRKKEEMELKLAQEKKVAADRDIATLVSIFTPESFESKAKDENKCIMEEVDVKSEGIPNIEEMESMPEDTCTIKEVEHEPLKKTPTESESCNPPDIYSEKFNLSDLIPKTPANVPKQTQEVPVITEDKPKNEELVNNANPTDVAKNNDSGDHNILISSTNGENDYFVESFQKNVPYAEPENKESDFLPK